MTDTDCVFCDLTQFRAADVCIENAFCLYASTRDPRDPPDVLPGCGVIIPLTHRLSPFDFTPEEWAATHEREHSAAPGRLPAIGTELSRSSARSASPYRGSRARSSNAAVTGPFTEPARTPTLPLSSPFGT